jgi:putative hydrolase of the HAD superfamily
MQQRYKHLFFDLDHTLWDFDTNSEKTLLQLFNEYELAKKGVPDFEVFKSTYKIHNDKMWERFRNGFIKREELRWKRIWLTLLDFKIANTPLAYEMSAAYLEILPTQTVLMPFAKETLAYCKNHYSLHLITNGFETTQWQKLQYSGIKTFFETVITSEKSNSMKPHKGIFDYALEMTKAQPEDCLMIGDALEIDVLGAHNAGWDQVYFNPHKTAHSSKPTFEISCLSELMHLL